eukprot:Clim_evm139s157 gene=Clim_evmTU139s157
MVDSRKDTPRSVHFQDGSRVSESTALLANTRTPQLSSSPPSPWFNSIFKNSRPLGDNPLVEHPLLPKFNTDASEYALGKLRGVSDESLGLVSIVFNKVNALKLLQVLFALVAGYICTYIPADGMETSRCVGLVVVMCVLWGMEPIPTHIAGLMIPLIATLFPMMHTEATCVDSKLHGKHGMHKHHHKAPHTTNVQCHTDFDCFSVGLSDHAHCPSQTMTSSQSAVVLSESFFKPMIFLFIGTFAISAALSKRKLDVRFARWVIRNISRDPKWVMLFLMITGWFLSMWVTNIAGAIAMVAVSGPLLVQTTPLSQQRKRSQGPSSLAVDPSPVVISENSRQEGSPREGRSTPLGATSITVDDKRTVSLPQQQNTFAKALLLGIAFACDLGGQPTPIASPQNLLAKQDIQELIPADGVEPNHLTFVQWMCVGIVPSLIAVVLIWAILWFYFKPGDITLQSDIEDEIYAAVKKNLAQLKKSPALRSANANAVVKRFLESPHLGASPLLPPANRRQGSSTGSQEFSREPRSLEALDEALDEIDGSILPPPARSWKDDDSKMISDASEGPGGRNHKKSPARISASSRGKGSMLNHDANSTSGSAVAGPSRDFDDDSDVSENKPLLQLVQEDPQRGAELNEQLGELIATVEDYNKDSVSCWARCLGPYWYRRELWDDAFVVVVSGFTITMWVLSNSPAIHDIIGDTGIMGLVPVIAFYSTGLLNKEDFKNMQWNVIILVGSGLALGTVIQSSGLLGVLSTIITDHGPNQPFPIVVILNVVVWIIANFVSHTAAAAVTMPLVIGIGSSYGKGRIAALLAVMSDSCAMGLPVSGFPNTVAFGVHDITGKTQYLTAGDFMKTGFPLGFMTVGIVSTVGYAMGLLIGL